MLSTPVKPSVDLTATEISNLWSSYLKNSMVCRFYEYFYAVAEEPAAKSILEQLLRQSRTNLEELQEIFRQEHLTVPVGFTEDDRNVSAGKVLSDTFMLYFCHDLTMLSLSTYPSALSDSTRHDVRSHFQNNIEFTMQIQNELTDVMLSQGVYVKPPQVAVNDKHDTVDSLSYLFGTIGDNRALNTAEIANLTRIIHRGQYSKMIFVVFHQLAATPELKKYCSKGRDALDKVQAMLLPILDRENIQIAASGNFKSYDVGMSPFSDKLMLFFINSCLGLFCFNMIAQATASTLRSDIQLNVRRITKDMEKFYGQGVLLMMKEGWLEQPPQAVNRKL